MVNLTPEAYHGAKRYAEVQAAILAKFAKLDHYTPSPLTERLKEVMEEFSSKCDEVLKQPSSSEPTTSTGPSNSVSQGDKESSVSFSSEVTELQQRYLEEFAKHLAEISKENKNEISGISGSSLDVQKSSNESETSTVLSQKGGSQVVTKGMTLLAQMSITASKEKPETTPADGTVEHPEGTETQQQFGI